MMDFSLLSHSPFSLALYTRVVDREAERTKDGARKLAGGVTDGRGREGLVVARSASCVAMERSLLRALVITSLTAMTPTEGEYCVGGSSKSARS